MFNKNIQPMTSGSILANKCTKNILAVAVVVVMVVMSKNTQRVKQERVMEELLTILTNMV